MEKPAEPRLVADVMVGRLARWLRSLGVDVLYSNRFEDDEIVRIAHAENRIVLTRDRALAASLAPDLFIFIHDDHVEFQVDEVLERIGPLEFRLLSRCLECNTVLEKADKESIFEQVPHYVYLTQNEFARCPSCKRIYWRGTHAGQIANKLRRWKQI